MQVLFALLSVVAICAIASARDEDDRHLKHLRVAYNVESSGGKDEEFVRNRQLSATQLKRAIFLAETEEEMMRALATGAGNFSLSLSMKHSSVSLDRVYLIICITEREASPITHFLVFLLCYYE